jgi:hypothetical protein
MKVKCVNAESCCNITVGKTYDVLDSWGDFYEITNDMGNDSQYRVGRFEVVEDQPKYPFNVRCVDDEGSDGFLRNGNVYTAVGEYEGADFVLKEVTMTWAKNRFEIVKDESVDHMAEVQKLRDEMQTAIFQTYMPDPEEEKLAKNKYHREIKPGVWVDVYDVLRAFNVTDPCLQHLTKKSLAGGQRGHKDLREDLQDIFDSAKRAVEMFDEWHKEINLDFGPIS